MKPVPDQRRKSRGLLLLSKMLSPVLKPTLSKRGLVEATILLDWAKIVGDELASLSYPEKITCPPGMKRKGTLLLNVDPSAALQLQYALDLILDRINGFYGYEAVARIKLQQQPVSLKPSPPSSFPRQKEAVHDFDETSLEDIPDPALKEALRNLARALPSKAL